MLLHHGPTSDSHTLLPILSFLWIISEDSSHLMCVVCLASIRGGFDVRAKVVCGEDVWPHVIKRRFKLVFCVLSSQLFMTEMTENTFTLDLGLLLPFLLSIPEKR